jgi:putative inorganic carbon (hco3(-)) transporter
LLVLLLLTQSRGSWASLGATLLVMVAIQRRVVVWLVVLGVPVALAAAIFISSSAGAMAMQQPGSASLSLAGRYELWARAIEAIRDVPFTGFGLNAFHHIVHNWYPLVLLPEEVDITHAHNVFLQTALDGGLPALVAYVSLLLVVTMLTAQIFAQGQLRHRALALGLFGNVCAVHVFGLTDAIALGAKVGVLLWSSIGLLGALHRSVCVPPVK